MTHVDLASKLVKNSRLQSIEINMIADAPGSIWMAGGLGPFGSIFVEKGTEAYLAKEDGGVEDVASPFGKRTVFSRYADNKMNSNPHGEWNTLEAIVRGGESVEIIYNGETVNIVTDLRDIKKNSRKTGMLLVEGGIGLQSEGKEIFYRNFVIKELEP